MNATVTIKKCSMNKIVYAPPVANGSYTVCFFTANLKGQAAAFPDNIQKCGTTAFFKVSSYHLPKSLLNKMSFNLEGHWEKDTNAKSQDGHIFIAEKASESLPETTSEIIKFFEKNCKGVGKVMATEIANAFGAKTLDICAHQPKKLEAIPKMTPALLGNINSACLSALVRADVQALLKDSNVEVSVIDKIVEEYSDEATTILRCEPYKTVSLLGFSTADKIAMSLGEDADSVRRMHAATVEAQKRACARTGNMCAEQDAIKAQLQVLTPEVSSDVMDKAIVEVAQTYDIVKQGKYYYDKSDFLTERKMAAKIAELACVKPSKEAEIEKAFIEWQQENSMILSPRQAEAVRNLKYRISIVTGGPGTGKTTCLRAIMDVYHKVWPSEHILLMAPTGLAAKRMAESTKTNSATIHKACCLVPADNNSGFVAQSECRICGFVGIDEMSMVGEHLFAFAIDAVLNSPSTRIVLLGDTDQLAPVSRGDVLRDLIQCSVIKTVRLDVNYRQGSTSTITDASIKIRENRAYSGMTRNLKFDDEFNFISVTNPDQKTEADKILSRVVEEYQKGVAKYGVKGTIILTPTHFDKGTATGYLCKNRVNAVIQSVVNPKTDTKPFLEVNHQTFMVGDRIIQRRNTDQVINGDLGTIISINKVDNETRVEIIFDSKEDVLVYDSNDVKDIELAYAVTIHSSQGSEFPCCIIPVSSSYGPMLTKPVYYTGITRAKKKLILIGDEEALKRAVRTTRTQGRKSLLGPRILKKVQAK